MLIPEVTEIARKPSRPADAGFRTPAEPWRLLLPHQGYGTHCPKRARTKQIGDEIDTRSGIGGLVALSGTDSTDLETVTIVGAGMAGAACAVALVADGVPVRLIDRGRAVGGRMASPLLDGRRVDIGAGYFTVRDPGFDAVVQSWRAAGLVREWTDTFGLLTPGSPDDATAGPMRWATPSGLRSLVRSMLGDLPVETGSAVTDLPAGPVVLAMPDPQAVRLTAVPSPVGCDPVITLVAGFTQRSWTFSDAAFVHDHAVIDFVADDGARRGDGAPVLVAHSTAAFARRHLGDPEGATEPMVTALRDLLDLEAPGWTHIHRWTFAKPSGAHTTTYGLVDQDGRRIGFAGDQWCPAGSPRIESAWRSGTDMAAAFKTPRRAVL